MKISHSTQRRTIAFAVAAALLAMFQILYLGVQLFYSTNPYTGAEGYTFIGELSAPFSASNDGFAYTIERDAEGEPLVEAMPTSMVLFSRNPDYVRPDHYGWLANRIVIYAVVALFVVMVALLAWLVVSAIRGFRTGNIFRAVHPRLLRWLAAAMFLYYLLVDNREVFRMIATKDCYGEMMPFELFGSVELTVESLVAPLLLLIFAELMAVAATINEDEVMTI